MLVLREGHLVTTPHGFNFYDAYANGR